MISGMVATIGVTALAVGLTIGIPVRAYRRARGWTGMPRTVKVAAAFTWFPALVVVGAVLADWPLPATVLGAALSVPSSALLTKLAFSYLGDREFEPRASTDPAVSGEDTNPS